MDAKEWFAESFLNENSAWPFSFVYGGRKSDELLKAWQRSTVSRKADSARNLHVLTCEDPETGLAVTCQATEYPDFPAVEWVLGFKNNGKIDTPILENIQALDAGLVRNADAEFVLHHMRGSLAHNADFTPLKDIPAYFTSIRLSCAGGRSSNGAAGAKSDGAFPFFDLAFDGGGVTVAIGWSGQWAAEFRRVGEKGLAVVAGMEHTHLKLLPGEEIRTPRILMFFWEGELADAHNDFRRFILKHHTPLMDNKPVTCPVAANTWFQYNWGNGVTEENQIATIREIVEAGIKLDCYWLDAGWYEGVGNWAFDVGNWFPKKRAFPRGLKPVADEARKHGLGFVLWFEPERVHPDTWLYDNHPEWLLMPNEDATKKRQLFIDKVEALLDLGNPEARRWLTDHISSMIEEVGITVYRQDFNFDPLDYWRGADEPDRQGISEIRHIEGLYAFWDELLRRHPGLMIDNCASGGRRIDLETISRSVALWRSDYWGEPEGVQSHTLGINRYVPCSSGGCNSTDAYIFRSNLASGMSICWRDPNAARFDIDELGARIEEFKLIRPLFYGDFYPLTSHSVESDAWCAYQLYRKDLNLGAVLAFRRKASPFPAGRFKLHGLDADEKYEFTDIDSGSKQEFTGRELLETGIEIKMPTAPCSMLLTYRRRLLK